MFEIKLNPQERKFLEEYLIYAADNEWMSHTSRAIIEKIISKLEKE